MNSEYANPVELMGLGEVNEELLGYLNALNPVDRAKAVNKLSKKHIPSQGSRAEFEKFFPELPQHIKEQLLNGKLRLADHTVYAIKAVGGAKTIKMFEPQDVREVGLRNISNAKLPKNMALLVSGIIMLQANAAGVTIDDLKVANLGNIKTVPAIANGEFKLKANKKQLVSDISNRNFVTAETQLYPEGFYKLSNPRLIHDDLEIEFEIELGTVTGIPANTVIYVGLFGTATIP